MEKPRCWRNLGCVGVKPMKNQERRKIMPKPRNIEVQIYPSRVYLDGVPILHEELQTAYDEMYKALNAKYCITFT